MGVDPLASDFAAWSPFSYSFNNPIRFIDPDGRAPEDAVEDCCPGMDVKFRVNSTGVTREAEEYARQLGAKEVAQAVRIMTPFEDIYSIFSGQDFDGNSVSRGEAIGWTAASFIPFAKIGKLGKFAKVATKNGDEILRVSDDASSAFKEAVEGGKHSGFLKNVLNTNANINKSINKLTRRIDEHLGYIENPKVKYGDEWDTFSDARKSREINHWKTEVQTFSEQRDILNDIINLE